MYSAKSTINVLTLNSLALEEWDTREYTSKILFWAWLCSPVNWNLSVDMTIRLSSRKYIGMQSFMSLFVLCEWIRCENIYSWFGRIQNVFSLFFWVFKETYKFLQFSWSGRIQNVFSSFFWVFKETYKFLQFSWSGRIQNVFSSFFWVFKETSKFLH